MAHFRSARLNAISRSITARRQRKAEDWLKANNLRDAWLNSKHKSIVRFANSKGANI